MLLASPREAPYQQSLSSFLNVRETAQLEVALALALAFSTGEAEFFSE